MAERKTIEGAGTGIGDGHLECDGKNHWWVVAAHKDLNCLPETHAGPCRCLKQSPPEQPSETE